MKKNTVLFVLFILPIVAYLFFASGVNSYTKLPILVSKVPDLGNWKSLSNQKISLNGKITILGFAGNDVLKNRGNFFNFNAKIYQRYQDFKDLQFVVICPLGTEEEIKAIVTALSATSNVSGWQFLFTTPSKIQSYYNQLKLSSNLNPDLGTANVFIIDKLRNLRGRKDKDGLQDGYSTFYPSELSNKMLDDFKIILYEYRAALKKNNNATKQL
jgi:hypothetical protein